MNIKLPGAAVLKSHLKSGMDRNQIAERYGVHRDTVSANLAKYKLEHLAPARSEGASRRITRHPVRESITIEPDRVVIIREMVAGENGGVSLRCMSLPRNSMHIKALQERGL
jgi:transposase